jgi:putative GTP pyrophosphokinase
MHQITELYKSEQQKYEHCQLKAVVLLDQLLAEHNIKFHKIESRIKDPQKLGEKIVRKLNKYKDINEITDIVGLRVITYFEDEVDKVASLIESEFVIDRENSIDKRKTETDRFGYMSLHYVVSLSDSRKKLIEYKKIGDIKIEIQIRSILQHAWAEIEHDIGYKGENAVPDNLKRNIFRVAALLETADIEFVNIKKSLFEYEQTVAQKINIHPEEIEINGKSFLSFINLNKTAIELDQAIADYYKTRIRETGILNIIGIVDMLLYLKVKTIKELEIKMVENKELILPYMKRWVKDSKIEGVGKGLSMYYLCLIILAKHNDSKFSRNFYQYFFQHREENRGNEINAIYNEIMQNTI